MQNCLLYGHYLTFSSAEEGDNIPEILLSLATNFTTMLSSNKKRKIFSSLKKKISFLLQISFLFRHSGVFIVNSKHISHLDLAFLLLTLSR